MTVCKAVGEAPGNGPVSSCNMFTPKDWIDAACTEVCRLPSTR